MIQNNNGQANIQNRKIPVDINKVENITPVQIILKNQLMNLKEIKKTCLLLVILMQFVF